MGIITRDIVDSVFYNTPDRSVFYAVFECEMQVVIDQKDLEKFKIEFYNYPKEITIRHWKNHSDVVHWRNKTSKIIYKRTYLNKGGVVKLEDKDDIEVLDGLMLERSLIDLNTGEIVAQKGEVIPREVLEKLFNGLNTYAYKW